MCASMRRSKISKLNAGYGSFQALFDIDIEVNMVDTPLLNQYSYLVNYDKIMNTGFVPKDNIKLEIGITLDKLRNLK